MAAVDAAWYRLDEPHNTTDIVALIELDQPVDPDRLRGLLASRFERFPALTSRVRDPHGVGLPLWEPVEDFDVDDHLHHHRLDEGTEEELRALVGTVLTEPLDGDRPLWALHIVDNVDGGGALIAKVHHCIGDGFALVGLLLTLAEDAPPPGPTVAGRTEEAVGWRGRWSEELADAVRNPERIAGWLRTGGRIAETLGRLVALPFDSPSTLRRPLTGVRRAAWSREIPLDRFKVLARATGGTVNDVLLAALSGALRQWLGGTGDPVDHLALRAIIPVNLRPVEEMGQALGNRFGLVFLDLPVREEDPLARLRQVHDAMDALKDGDEAIASVVALTALGVVPETVEQLAGEVFTRKGSLVVTNVPGPRRRLRFAGKTIRNLMFWVPHASRVGLGVSLMSYAGAVRIGVRADTGITRHPEHLARAFEDALEQMEAELL